MPPTEPFSYLVLAGVAQQLMEIRTDNGFYTDAGALVTVEREQELGDDDPMPAMQLRVVGTLIAPPKDQQGKPIPSRRVMNITIEGAIAADGQNSQLIAHRLIADIETALKKNACNTPNGAAPVWTDQAVIVDRPDGAPVVIVQLTGTVRYVVN